MTGGGNIVLSNESFQRKPKPFAIYMAVYRNMMKTSTMNVTRLLAGLPIPRIQAVASFSIDIGETFANRREKKLARVRRRFSGCLIYKRVRRASFQENRSGIFATIDRRFFVFRPLFVTFFFRYRVTNGAKYSRAGDNGEPNNGGGEERSHKDGDRPRERKIGNSLCPNDRGVEVTYNLLRLNSAIMRVPNARDNFRCKRFGGTNANKRYFTRYTSNANYH